MPLPLDVTTTFTRENFIVSGANSEAVAFIESWSHWPVAAAALHGPPHSGKTHLVEVWRAKSGAQVVAAAALSGSAFAQIDRTRPLAIEDVDASLPNPARDAALFQLLESATLPAPLLFTGRSPPAQWPVTLPDLASRLAALVAWPLADPDDALLAQMADSLFAARQLVVPHPVISQILKAVERSPAALRAFIERLDRKALAEKRPITTALVRDLLGSTENPPS
ncbi:MAG TPA: hypothetical protein VGM17_10725 [Rhizomicrobium sp.]|jgi:chromosomal replication initiation ATPase DnaA